MQKRTPIRMCIVCRGRFEQDKLLRLQYIDGELVRHTKIGRSFYICRECMGSKNLTKKLSSFLKIPKTETEHICEKLKETAF